MLGWPNEGKSYDRIKLSLQRIANVTYNYDNAWWDPRQKTWTTKIFHIIDTVEINDSRVSDGQGGLFPSRIVWNEVVFDSFQAGFLRNIDFQLCMRLEHPTALRIYRFLGKRFYHKPDWTFDLKEFAYEHIGLGRNYEGGTQIARKLQPAIDELEGVGFLAPLSENERFIKKARDWSIRLIQQSPTLLLATETLPAFEAAISPLASDLVEHGVTKMVAEELVQQHPPDRIQQKLEVFAWLVETQDKRVAKSPAGYLVKSIMDDYATPKGFVPKAEREALAQAKREADQKSAEDRRRKHERDALDQARRRKADAYIKQLNQAERIVLESEALAAASPEARENYESHVMARFRDTLILAMLRDHVADKLEREQIPVEA